MKLSTKFTHKRKEMPCEGQCTFGYTCVYLQFGFQFIYFTFRCQIHPPKSLQTRYQKDKLVFLQLGQVRYPAVANRLIGETAVAVSASTRQNPQACIVDTDGHDRLMDHDRSCQSVSSCKQAQKGKET